MQALRSKLLGFALAALVLLSGCASQHSRQNTPADMEDHWQGRLAVKVFSKPVQAFSANFALQGQSRKGVLVLSSPLGTTLASMQWDAQSATLVTNGKKQDFGTLQELAQQVTGADIPVASLFAWLNGHTDAEQGWQVDLTDLPNGRIQAHHTEEVQAELKIILDR